MRIETNNLNHKQIARLASVAIGVLCGILIWGITSKWKWALFCFLVLFVFCYYLISYLLDRFVYQNIRLMYRLISTEKASMKKETDLREKSLDDVKIEVAKWAVEKRGEISRLQNNESFRKEFLMNLAHELRTPIFSIQGYIATLLDGEINNPEVNVKFLENASKSADRLSGLVDDLREISHYESQRIRLEKSTFSIQKLLKKIFDELQPMADKKGIMLSIKKGCEKDYEIWADKERIEQVLINLVVNAIKYGKEDGYARAGVYSIDGKQVLIEISDNGIGMDPEHSIRAFERFFRTDDARTVDKHGNGLGLAIVKHIIEAHGQTISCRSQKDIGTTFSFTLVQDED